MAVQDEVQLFQDSSGLGIIEENQPNDIASFMAGQDNLRLGTFASYSGQGLDVLLPNDTLKLVGVITKQQDKIPLGEGINRDTDKNASFFYGSKKGRSISILKNGYVGMLCESDWNYLDDVYVRIATGNSNGVIGSVASGKDTDTDYKIVANASFQNGGEATKGIARVYLDLRVPVIAGGSLSNVWTTN